MTLTVLVVLSQLEAYGCTTPDPANLSPDAGYGTLFDSAWAPVLAEPETVVLRGHAPPFPERAGESMSATWSKLLLRVNQRERVKAVVTSPSSFIVSAPLVCPPNVMWGIEPLCDFRPTLSVSFTRGGRSLALFMCFDCKLVVIVRTVGGETVRTNWATMGSAELWQRTFTRLAR